jgi:hypothetical protein
MSFKPLSKKEEFIAVNTPVALQGMPTCRKAFITRQKPELYILPPDLTTDVIRRRCAGHLFEGIKGVVIKPSCHISIPRLTMFLQR